MPARFKVALKGSISYQSRTHEAGGRVADGWIVRDRAFLTVTSPSGDRSFELQISGLNDFPGLLASIAIEPGNEDEAREEFIERLETRDNLAKAFEAAAKTLRAAQRS